MEARQGGVGRGSVAGAELKNVICFYTDLKAFELNLEVSAKSVTFCNSPKDLYMEEQFGLPEGLSVMDVITRSEQFINDNVKQNKCKLFD